MLHQDQTINAPIITVVMSVYNAEKYISSAIESILNQSFRDFEFIIIDDGSSDASLEIIKKFEKKDARIRIITRENKGLVASLNEGILASKGGYIARMDADDIALPSRIEEQYEYMKLHKLSICGTHAVAVDSEGGELFTMSYPPLFSQLKIFSLLHNPFIHPSVMLNKEILLRTGVYSSFFKHIEDYELWTRIIFRYKAGNIPKALLQYRIHSGQVTKKHHTSMFLKGFLVRFLALIRYLLYSNPLWRK